jgi:hypothetical protein
LADHEETSDRNDCVSANEDLKGLFCGLGGDCGQPDHHHHGDDHKHESATCTICQTLLRPIQVKIGSDSTSCEGSSNTSTLVCDVETHRPWLLVGPLSARGPPA